jgi:hypothetical protein
MIGKMVRFKTPGGAMQQGRVMEQYVLHGRTRYKVETEFGEVFFYADEIEEFSAETTSGTKRAP